MHPISLVSDADFDESADVVVKNIPNRQTIEAFPIETPSLWRSMKQDLSDNTTPLTC